VGNFLRNDVRRLSEHTAKRWRSNLEHTNKTGHNWAGISLTPMTEVTVLK